MNTPYVVVPTTPPDNTRGIAVAALVIGIILIIVLLIMLFIWFFRSGSITEQLWTFVTGANSGTVNYTAAYNTIFVNGSTSTTSTVTVFAPKTGPIQGIIFYIDNTATNVTTLTVQGNNTASLGAVVTIKDNVGTVVGQIPPKTSAMYVWTSGVAITRLR